MRVATAVAVLLAGAALMHAWRLGEQAPGLDFYQFWAGAQVVRANPGTNLYAAETRGRQHDVFLQRSYAESRNMMMVARARQEFEFFSTPFLYTTFAIFPGRHYDADLFAYRLAMLGAFAGGVLLVARALGLSWAAALVLLAFSATLFQPFQSEIRVVNVNSVQFFGIGAAIFLAQSSERWRWCAAAALFALVAMFKPNVALILPLLIGHRLLTREWRRAAVEAAGAAAGVIAAFTISSVYFGSMSAWLQWTGAARNLAATLLPLASGNVAPALPLARLLGSHATLFISAMLCGAILVAIARSRRGDAATIVGAGLLVYLLAATLVWLHYLVLALPLIITLVADRMPLRRLAGWLSLTLIGGDLWTGLLNVRTALGEARLLWLGLAILFGASLVRLASRERVEMPARATVSRSSRPAAAVRRRPAFR